MDFIFGSWMLNSVFAAMLGDFKKDKVSLIKFLIPHENRASMRDSMVLELLVAALSLDGLESVVKKIRVPSNTNL